MSLSPLNAVKALIQLGPEPVALNALYRFGLLSGHYRRVTARIGGQAWEGKLAPGLFPAPTHEELVRIIGSEGRDGLLAEAEEVMAGRVRLFGGEAVPLVLSVDGPLRDWTAYERGKAALRVDGVSVEDVKFIWEPARFGWAFTLGRAHLLTGDEKYAETFWRYFEQFEAANPPCLGPNWVSGQEVALRLIAFVWAGQVFEAAASSTPRRKARLAQAVAAHALRIPPTLVYARSQQNNHLLSEAAGLLTAGLTLPDHPRAARWQALGWKWLTLGLQRQIDGYGEYAQHSTNYQRLMLQLVLWVNTLLRGQGLRWPRRTRDAILRSIHWMLSVLDPETGHTPNLGANDGALLFPLSGSPFEDYRPVLHAAARAFLNYDLPRGPWDELALWLGIPFESKKYIELPRYLGDQLYGRNSWAYLRTAQYRSRPSHADQLHLDLWWRGLNIARDAGTYLYNAGSPWDNRLTSALVHNTVTADGRDQFTRAGRFLYLDWFDAYRQVSLGGDETVLQSASAHYHARHLPAYRHTRTVTAFTGERWGVRDDLLVLRYLPGLGNPRPVFRLHWLLPDWEWEMAPLPENIGPASGCDLHLRSPHGLVIVRMHTKLNDSAAIGLVRAGERLYGSLVPAPVEGWVSPTYGVKLPALSLSMQAAMPAGGSFESEFIFPESV